MHIDFRHVFTSVKGIGSYIRNITMNISFLQRLHSAIDTPTDKSNVKRNVYIVNLFPINIQMLRIVNRIAFRFIKYNITPCVKICNIY